MAQSKRVRTGKRGSETWRSYEALVQEIFQAILNQDSVQNIRVQHDLTLQGKTATHQIDVYWKFRLGGVQYETIVQVKDWATPVDQGQLFQFKTVLDDLIGRPTGIFVTRSGYQSGAKEFASAHGIILYELEEAQTRNSVTLTTFGWASAKAVGMSFQGSTIEGVAVSETALGIEFTVFEPHLSDIRFEIDRTWFEQNSLTCNLDTLASRLRSLPFVEILLYDEVHTPISNVELIVRQAIEVAKENNVHSKQIVHRFEQPTFLGPPCTDFSSIKVNAISSEIEIRSNHIPPRYNLSKFVRLVLREIGSAKLANSLNRKNESAIP